jgi:hypothetical protein
MSCPGDSRFVASLPCEDSRWGGFKEQELTIGGFRVEKDKPTLVTVDIDSSGMSSYTCGHHGKQKTVAFQVEVGAGCNSVQMTASYDGRNLSLDACTQSDGSYCFVNHPPTAHPPTAHPPTAHPPTAHPPTTHPPTTHPPSRGPSRPTHPPAHTIIHDDTQRKQLWPAPRGHVAGFKHALDVERRFREKAGPLFT